MNTQAFVLIETSVGRTKEVLAALKQVRDVTSVDAVTGPYDLIAVVQGNDLNAVGEAVTSRIHTIPGIARTVTCLAVSLP